MFQLARFLIPLVIVFVILEVCTSQPVKSSLPRPYKCGNDDSPRILHGPAVGIGQFPWTALIQYRKANGSLSFNCAATLINERYVLTGAHCISGLPETWQIVGVRLGEHDLQSEQDCEGEEEFKICADPHQDLSIEKIVVHEDYNATGRNFQSDIALIRLARDVVFSDFIQPVCLPIEAEDRQRNNTDQRAIEVGWSRTLNSPLTSNKRHKSLTIIKDPNICDEAYKNHGIMKLHDSQLCVSRAKNDVVCHTIGGSPLMQPVGRTLFLYGISSFGPTRCASNVPDVFTNVAKFVDWIESNIE